MNIKFPDKINKYLKAEDLIRSLRFGAEQRF